MYSSKHTILLKNRGIAATKKKGIINLTKPNNNRYNKRIFICYKSGSQHTFILTHVKCITFYV